MFLVEVADIPRYFVSICKCLVFEFSLNRLLENQNSFDYLFGGFGPQCFLAMRSSYH